MNLPRPIHSLGASAPKRPLLRFRYQCLVRIEPGIYMAEVDGCARFMVPGVTGYRQLPDDVRLIPERSLNGLCTSALPVGVSWSVFTRIWHICDEQLHHEG